MLTSFFNSKRKKLVKKKYVLQLGGWQNYSATEFVLTTSVETRAEVV